MEEIIQMLPQFSEQSGAPSGPPSGMQPVIPANAPEKSGPRHHSQAATDVIRARKEQCLGEIKRQLTVQRNRYPLMNAEDVVKLVFQGMMGVGHLIRDPGAALEWLKKEMDGLDAPDVASPIEEPLIEELSTSWVRLNLRPARASGMTAEEIAGHLMRSAASCPPAFTREDVRILCESLDPGEEMKAAAARLQDEDWLPSHSAAYRAAYHPSYRVLRKSFSRTVYVDADACPVTRLAEQIAKAYGMPAVLLCDTNHQLTSDYSTVRVIGAGADAVDIALINLCHRGDVVVTQDYGVAALALGKGAKAIHQSGKWYTDENIDGLLMERHLAKKARRSNKHHLKGPAKRTEEDDRRFAESFERLLWEAQNPGSL